MIRIEEIESEGLFKLDKLEKYKFVIGEYATYNKYYKITIEDDESKIEIGLQTIFVGIEPQAELFSNKILLGAGEKFYVYDLDGNLIKEYLNSTVFYEFIVKDGFILIISELDVLLLDDAFEKIWENNFSEIISLEKIEGNRIVLKDYTEEIITLDFLTGKRV